MKKLIVTLTAVAVLAMSLLSVAASEVVEAEVTEKVTQMDGATYLELRLTRLNEALASGEIEQEDYDLLVAHINDNAAEGSFGKGPSAFDEDKECVLGEDGNLGIFRTENSGSQNGQGNGVKNQSTDGSGTGSRGANKGQGNQSESKGSNGTRLQDGSAENEDCIVD